MRYINYRYPRRMLTNVAINLKTRAVSLSSPENTHEALDIVQGILIQNLYPKILYCTTPRRPREEVAPTFISSDRSQNLRYYNLTFVNRLSNNNEKIFREVGIFKIAYKHQKTIGRLFLKLRDPSPVDFDFLTSVGKI